MPCWRKSADQRRSMAPLAILIGSLVDRKNFLQNGSQSAPLVTPRKCWILLSCQRLLGGLSPKKKRVLVTLRVRSSTRVDDVHRLRLPAAPAPRRASSNGAGKNDDPLSGAAVTQPARRAAGHRRTAVHQPRPTRAMSALPQAFKLPSDIKMSVSTDSKKVLLETLK